MPSGVRTLLQQAEKALLGHRRRDQDALAEIATHYRQGVQVGGPLDAFGNRCAVEPVREIDRENRTFSVTGGGERFSIRANDGIANFDQIEVGDRVNVVYTQSVAVAMALPGDTGETAAVGAAATGLRPIVELMFIDFIGVAMDQLFNQAAKMRYMFGGKAKIEEVRNFFANGTIFRQVASSLAHHPDRRHTMPSAGESIEKYRKEPGL